MSMVRGLAKRIGSPIERRLGRPREGIERNLLGPAQVGQHPSGVPRFDFLIAWEYQTWAFQGVFLEL
jgi:hypothetical protein